jgi:hypothetical protein
LFTYTCITGGDEIVHLSGIDVAEIAANSSLSNVFTISGIGYKKACVKKENFWNIVGESKAKKNNDKDKNNGLVIAIFSRKV